MVYGKKTNADTKNNIDSSELFFIKYEYIPNCSKTITPIVPVLKLNLVVFFTVP